MQLKGGTYKTEELTVQHGEPFTLPEGAIVVSATHTMQGAFQVVVLAPVPDGKPALNEPRQKGGR